MAYCVLPSTGRGDSWQSTFLRSRRRETSQIVYEEPTPDSSCTPIPGIASHVLANTASEMVWGQTPANTLLLGWAGSLLLAHAQGSLMVELQDYTGIQGSNPTWQCAKQTSFLLCLLSDPQNTFEMCFIPLILHDCLVYNSLLLWKTVKIRLLIPCRYI